jgi:hypothetical protein
VWESWKESYQIFRAKGQTPLPWNAPATLPEACKSLKPGRLLQQMGKVPDVLNEFIQPFESGPLVDQNGVYTRNEIVVNQSMFDGIVNNGLYSIEGQQKFFAASPSNAVAFSCGSAETKQVGAVMAPMIAGRISTPSMHWSIHRATTIRVMGRLSRSRVYPSRSGWWGCTSFIRPPMPRSGSGQPLNM